MSEEIGPLSEERLPDFSALERGRFSYLPVVPGRVEFSMEVRRRILAQRPEVVAVELPDTLESAYLDAIQRLPQISIVFYTDPQNRVRAIGSDEDGDQAVYVPVEPADPCSVVDEMKQASG